MTRQLIKGLHLKVADYIVFLLNVEWHSQNEVDNIGILVLWSCPATQPEIKWLVVNLVFVLVELPPFIQI